MRIRVLRLVSGMPADDLRGAKRADRGRPSPRRQADTHGSPLCNDTRREGEGRCDARHGHFLFLPRLPSRGVSRVAAIGLALACSRPECSAQVVISDGVGGHWIHVSFDRASSVGITLHKFSARRVCTSLSGPTLGGAVQSPQLGCSMVSLHSPPAASERLDPAVLRTLLWMGNQKVQSAKMRAP